MHRTAVLSCFFLASAAALAVGKQSQSVVSAAIAQHTSSSIDLPMILSDIYGYDFSRYMGELMNRVRQNGYTMMPEAALREEKKGRVVVIFTIIRDGNVQDLRMAARTKVHDYYPEAA